jgi:ubiquinone/menaquinone biosynthesis C-methylase UbiE
MSENTISKKLALKICKSLMRIAESHPDPLDPHLWEVFKTDHYKNGTESYKAGIRNKSSQASYDYEQNEQDSWLVKYFFPRISPTELEDSVLLDLGCFTGGRLTAWVEKFRLKIGYGIDINPIFKIAADEFASQKRLTNLKFFTGFGESLPFEDSSIDVIVSTDVFEHVQNLEKVLDECHRVLKPGGKLCIVFPQYLQPLESHLGCVTRFPALHWIFTGDVITKAYIEIIQERENSNWYFPESYPLKEWEKLPSLNGITYKKFLSLLAKNLWSSKSEVIRPILSDGRQSKKPLFRILRSIFLPFAYMPFTRELFLGRVNFVVQK